LAILKVPGMVDHPGTPLQLFSALVIRIANIFRQETLIVDLLKHPEFYLDAIRSSLIFLHGTFLFLLGYFVHKASGKIIAAIFLQLTPFVSALGLSELGRLMIEQFFIFQIFLYIIVAYSYIEATESKNVWIDKYVLFFALIGGFGMATKITFFPLCLLGFILLNGIRKKIMFTIMSLASFFLFAFPIFSHWVFFSDWILGMFFHSGNYGDGPSEIINKNEYLNGLVIIFKYDIIFLSIILIMLFTSLIYHLPFLKLKRGRDKYYRGLIGVLLSVVVMIILIAKKPTIWYMTPAILISVFGLFLSIVILTRPLKGNNSTISLLIFSTFFIFCIYKFEISKLLQNHFNNINYVKELVNESEIVNKEYHDKPLLISTNDFGSSFKEYGIYAGIIKCGNVRKYYLPELIKIFPKIYFYYSLNQGYYFWNKNWDESIPVIDILKKYKNVILVKGYLLSETFMSDKFYGINRQRDTKIKQVHFNPARKETFYTIDYDSAASGNSTFKCDAENIDSSKIFYIDSGLKYGNGNTQSLEKCKSGKYSCKLTPANPEGFTCYLDEVCYGDKYQVSTWKYNNENLNSNLEVQIADTVILGNIVDRKNNWIKVQVDFTVSDKMKNKNAKILCFNNSKKLPAYFDDLIIVKH
jgi:hypothetical protein